MFLKDTGEKEFDAAFVRDFGQRDQRHPAIIVKAESKGVTGVTVCKYRFQGGCGDASFVTPTGSGQAVRAAVGGYTLRHDEKSAEVLDKQGVARAPLRKRVRNPLKRKDLNENGAERKTEQGERIEIGKWPFEAQCKQTRGRIAEEYTACQLLFC